MTVHPEIFRARVNVIPDARLRTNMPKHVCTTKRKSTGEGDLKSTQSLNLIASPRGVFEHSVEWNPIWTRLNPLPLNPN